MAQYFEAPILLDIIRKKSNPFFPVHPFPTRENIRRLGILHVSGEQKPRTF
jgi:hypothetical protein